ncbi:hypothetical protein J1614_003611 [Plenodomus biglobosus]|nr:hypothetical protein J1614_003611 [Plenodomus biglobosus]
MLHLKSLTTGLLALVSIVNAKSTPKLAEQPVVTYLGTQGPILSSGAWTSKGVVYTSGTVPSFNGSIVTGGIGPQTAQVIKNIAAVLEEAGTSWDYVLKTTVFLANMSDYTAMNEGKMRFLRHDPLSQEEIIELPSDERSRRREARNQRYEVMLRSIYAAMLPSPKPARTAVEVGKLPGNFLVEIEAIAAIPDS